MSKIYCGPKIVPNWIRRIFFGWFFDASCEKHDSCYKRGGNRVDRRNCDKAFLRAMLRDADKSMGIARFFKVKLALLYYLAVRVGGRFFFNYTE